MRNSVQFKLSKPQDFVDRLLSYSRLTDVFCLLNNNGSTSQNTLIKEITEKDQFDLLVGIKSIEDIKQISDSGSFENFKEFSSIHKDWLMGFLSYDLKNDLEDLSSENHDSLFIPPLYFFVPKWVLHLRHETLTIYYSSLNSEKEAIALKEEIEHVEGAIGKHESPTVKSRISKEEYLKQLEIIHKYIQRGDIYEVNFCQEFYAENAEIDPVEVYRKLNEKSPTPFSAYIKFKDHHVISASPERYIRKIGRKLYTQPMKGTAKRGEGKTEDDNLKNELSQNVKEQSENVMIVDLCRNDLSRVASRGSVKVDELFGVYTFPQVHQLISTVSAEIKEDLNFLEAIKCSFPMGSMTGAPKIRAMQIIEELEESKRGLFSGAIGYITPDRDFDFNVVIRSILYNNKNHYLSFTVGGAITILSDPNEEYRECLLKAKAMLEVLSDKKELHG